MMKKSENCNFWKDDMKKADIGLLCAILAIACLCLLFLHLHREKGSYMEISYDGVLLDKIPLTGQEEVYYLIAASENGVDAETQMTLQKLTKDADKEWDEIIARVEEKNRNGNYNIFMCQNKEVRMINANCPDQICVHHYPISAAGENIICLPHKVVIAITGEKGKELDGVVY